MLNWGGWIFRFFGGDPHSWISVYATEIAQANLSNNFFNDAGSVRNLGIIFGGFISALFASQFKIKRIKSKKQAILAACGGFLMGYGARIAGGCNVGGLFTATSALSLSGWIFAVFAFAGAFFGIKILFKTLED